MLCFHWQSPDVADFRRATIAVLAQLAPTGLFVVEEPTVLKEATITPVEGEGLAVSYPFHKRVFPPLDSLFQRNQAEKGRGG